uniref:Inactive receptor kinase At5g67200 family n=1 Tax=Cajanus cajan TaxID=3821 RepID=A0A151RIB1_CAJCA|nr:putative inactive receptor kinase At5g67200 family [Cajanus cajan]
MPNLIHSHSHLFLLRLLLILILTSTAHCSKLTPRHLPPLLFTDATALLAFKRNADVNNRLHFSPATRGLRFCAWEGVVCNGAKVERLILQDLDLRGFWPPNTLTRLDQLRVLSLQNNSLTGPVPDLTSLSNLKSLFLDHNHFTGSLPPSLFFLHRLRNLDFSHNNLSGSISTAFTNLDRLHTLRLASNFLNGSIPPFNQSSLKIFDVSANNLSGAIPLTPTLLRFPASSFAFNPNLCGEIIRVQCRPSQPFFGPAAPPTAPLGQSARGHGVDAAAVMRMEMERELEEKVKRAEVAKSGSLVFCAGEAQVYTLEQLMKGSAELLGRGCLGTTYKAVLDNRLMVTVKRLDAGKMAAHATKEVFERHMESVGGLRHPNLVPLRAYFQAKQERLIIYDFQPNGSLFSLIHGSRSSRARPLHWTSCLKIAEDVAQGLAFIHQAWRLVHGNLKSSNVLLGPDFEACITDYCLSVLTQPSIFDEDGDSAAYRAPETRNPNHHPTHKSDVYAYGVLLLELLTGKFPSELPFMAPGDMSSWVRSIRDDNGGEDGRMDMLLQVATTCSLTSPEQRPTMWQVLKMLQEIKEIVLLEDTGELELRTTDSMS